MTNETFKFNVTTAYGQTIPAVPVTGNFDAFDSYDELVAKNEIPDKDEILKYVNAKAKAAARAKATTEALDKAGYKKPTLEDVSVQISTMAKVFLARNPNMPKEEAEAKAKQVLGL